MEAAAANNSILFRSHSGKDPWPSAIDTHPNLAASSGVIIVKL